MTQNTPMKKKEFLKQEATKGTKTTVAFVWIIAILCIALIGAGCWMALNRSVLEIPAIAYAKQIIGSNDDIIEEFEHLITTDKNDPEGLYKYAKDSYEAGKEALTAEEQAMAEDSLAKCEKFIDNPNILNARSFYMSVMECIEHDNPVSIAYAEMFDYADAYGDVIAIVLLAIVAAIIGIAALSILFILISAGTITGGLVILSLILNAILQVLLINIPFTAVTAVLLIVLTILIGSINKAYKDYKKSLAQ